ncbi:MAG: hypothetical protein H5T50_05460 [Nitrososphaeria archaeon]|nr:hypothetical protein [Nitrososphaeria archaeon]
MVKVFSPHFHDMKGKIAYKKGRIGKVHFQKNRGNIAMHFTMKREREATPLQKQQRQAFKEAALSYRQLSKEERKNLALWGAMRSDLVSGYDWWTKAKLTDISIEVLIDDVIKEEVFLPNRNFEKADPGLHKIEHWVLSTYNAGRALVGQWYNTGSYEVMLNAAYAENSYASIELEKWFSIRILKDTKIEYGCFLHPDWSNYLPKIYLMMLGEDDSAYYDEFTPSLQSRDYFYYKKEVMAPANIKAIKIGAKSEKRYEDPDTAFIDGFRIYVEGRYLVAKCSHPLLQRVMITSEDGSIVYYDSNAY